MDNRSKVQRSVLRHTLALTYTSNLHFPSLLLHTLAKPVGAQLGLSRMSGAEYLFVQQDVEHFEALTGFETENR